MSLIREIGERRELFVDDWLIDDMDGLSLKLHHPVPKEVAIEFDRPWEGSVSYDPVVILEDDRYRLWYRGCGEDWEAQVTAYAESEDGIHWTRPNLGLFEYGGSRENNIVLRGTEAKALCVFKDGNPEPSESERFKAIGVDAKAGRPDRLRAFSSPDGLRWKSLETDPILIAPEDKWPMFDSHNVALWDDIEGQYVIYARGWLEPGIRSIRRTVSKDFRNWSDFEFIDMGETEPEHLYKNACTRYFRAPHQYLMFPKRFVPDRRSRDDWASGLSEGVFMSSRDGLHWDRRFMEAFLRLGPDPDNWTDRNMYIGVGVVPTSPTEMSIYYMEHYRHPTARMRRGALRIDGFVSVNAPWTGGEFVTHPLTFEGTALSLNFATSVAGRVRVEIQDEGGQPIPGFELENCPEIFGDEIERIISWNGGKELGSLARKPIRLRIEMKEADLYSIQFTSSTPA